MKKDIRNSIIVILLGICMMLLIFFIYNKAYEYHCDHIPISDAFQDQKCKNYFDKSTRD